MRYSKEISIKKSYDLVVCGGGMTGVACAVSAARKGVRTLLVEKLGCLGGVATSGQVNHLLGGGYHDDEGNYYDVIGGVFSQIANRLIAQGGAVDPSDNPPVNHRYGWIEQLAAGIIFDGELMKALLDELCRESGVDLLFCTDIVDVLLDGDRVTGLVVHNKSGLFAIEGRIFADTTGDADVAALAGCPYVLGREEDGVMAATTLELHVENVDGDALEEQIATHNTPRFRELIGELQKKGLWDYPYDTFISVQMVQPDIYMLNTMRQFGVNGVDGDAITQAMIDGRRENLALFDVVKKYFPGFTNARIRSIAPALGVRETRRIKGHYWLTMDDLSAGRRFDDCIAQTSYVWDLHNPPVRGIVLQLPAFKSRVKSIPYRCLVPQGVTNLIVAGRCISVERLVLGPIRVMGPCMGMGQAAGTAAYLALQQGVPFSDVNTAALRRLLFADGCLPLDASTEK